MPFLSFICSWSAFGAYILVKVSHLFASIRFTCAPSWPCSPGSCCPCCMVIAGLSSDWNHKSPCKLLIIQFLVIIFIKKLLFFPLVFLFCSGHLSWSACSGKKRGTPFAADILSLSYGKCLCLWAMRVFFFFLYSIYIQRLYIQHSHQHGCSGHANSHTPSKFSWLLKYRK